MRHSQQVNILIALAGARSRHGGGAPVPAEGAPRSASRTSVLQPVQLGSGWACAPRMTQLSWTAWVHGCERGEAVVSTAASERPAETLVEIDHPVQMRLHARGRQVGVPVLDGLEQPPVILDLPLLVSLEQLQLRPALLKDLPQDAAKLARTSLCPASASSTWNSAACGGAGRPCITTRSCRARIDRSLLSSAEVRRIAASRTSSISAGRRASKSTRESARDRAAAIPSVTPAIAAPAATKTPPP